MIAKLMILAVGILLLFGSLALADIIYLKDGTILRGKITKETADTVTIEGEDYWKTIKRADIERLVIEVQKTKEQTTTIKQGPGLGVGMLAGVGILFLVLLLVAIL